MFLYGLGLVVRREQKNLGKRLRRSALAEEERTGPDVGLVDADRAAWEGLAQKCYCRATGGRTDRD